MRLLKCFGVVGILCLLPCAVLAQEGVTFSYFLIKASRSETGEIEIDDSLKELAPVLKGTGYSKFQAIGGNRVSGQPGKVISVALTKEYVMALTAQRSGGTCAVRVQIIKKAGREKKTILDTTIPLKRGRPVVVVGPAMEGGTLLLVFVGQ
jgi:hypothetical protein